ncbi:MAG: phosphatidylcholine synthase [Pseudomonadota bacterium]
MERFKATAVHYFTATGAVLAMLALLAAVQERWDMMFFWLVVAFIVDGIDGPLARHYDVKKHAPQYDGVVLDILIDYLTYIFIPAYALFQSGVFDGWTGWATIIIITFTSALYMVNTGMKTKDKSFAGFPACWNMFAVFVFATDLSFWMIFALVVILALSMFTNLKFIHPIRTERWRIISLPIALIWTLCAGYAAWTNFEMNPVLTLIIVITSFYLLFVGIVQQIIPERKAA